MPESYDWEIGKEGSEAVAEIEEMGLTAGVAVKVLWNEKAEVLVVRAPCP